MNDVGPFVPASVAEHMSTYVGLDLDFETTGEIETYLRGLYPGFGNLTPAQWQHIARHSQRRKANGRLGLVFDPKIGLSLKPPFRDVNLWSLWDNISCPVLVLRGENSNVLLPEVAEEMTRRGPQAALCVIPGCGHAPPLMSAEQIAIVEDWLESGEIGEGSALS
jgi:pimeloyl-ACP methyl ester carboxylesterase